MDKKNTIIGAALLVAAFAVYFIGQHFAPPPPPAPAIVRSLAPAPIETAPANPAIPPAVAPSDATFAAIAKDSTEATITTLDNGFIEVRLTDFGGAVNEVAFKKYAAELGKPDPFVFNQPHVDPVLAFTEDSFPGLGRTARYQRVSATPTEVTYRLVLENNIEVTRRYVLRAASGTGSDDCRLFPG